MNAYSGGKGRGSLVPYSNQLLYISDVRNSARILGSSIPGIGLVLTGFMGNTIINVYEKKVFMT